LGRCQDCHGSPAAGPDRHPTEEAYDSLAIDLFFLYFTFSAANRYSMPPGSGLRLKAAVCASGPAPLFGESLYK
jgi:hypothetical protein